MCHMVAPLHITDVAASLRLMDVVVSLHITDMPYGRTSTRSHTEHGLTVTHYGRL